MTDKKLDETKLRGWAKDAQKRIDEALKRIGALEHTVASISVQRSIQGEDRYDPVPRHPIPLKDRGAFYKRRDRLRQVQIWTPAGEDEDGRLLLCSLDWSGKVDAGELYLATHDIDSIREEPYEEWLAKVLGEGDNANL
jgi:hypothetical protein